MKDIPGGVTAPKGFRASGLVSGVKKSGKPDLGLLVSDVPAVIAGAATQNIFAAPPVLWSRKVFSSRRKVRGVVVNSGVANACTGKLGAQNAAEMAAVTAGHLKCAAEEVLVASTGVIGQQLPMDNIRKGIAAAAGQLSEKGGENFATAIMTTDTVKKEVAVEIDVEGHPVALGGCTKGVGMLQPAMATLLGFLTTDARISPEALYMAFKKSLSRSLNRLTIDGDTSTNDMSIIMANGASGCPEIKEGPEAVKFTDALTDVMQRLAKMVAGDGEGATKRVIVRVTQAQDEAGAERVARTVANSPLVKTALFGNDPNWGRILAAAGRAGVSFQPEKCDLLLCGLALVEKGEPLAFDPKAAAGRLKAGEVDIEIRLNTGQAFAEIYTCDLSYDYVKINAEYHT